MHYLLRAVANAWAIDVIGPNNIRYRHADITAYEQLVPAGLRASFLYGNRISNTLSCRDRERLLRSLDGNSIADTIS